LASSSRSHGRGRRCESEINKKQRW
jgi:hypothetical protein